MDFGKINTAGVGVAQDKSTGVIYVFGEYHAGAKRDYADHIASMNALTAKWAGGKRYSPGCGGNKHGEDGWREAYRVHGLPLDEPPEGNIEVQIQGVWSLLNQRKLIFFRNSARETIEDVRHYSRKVDDDGTVLDAIADDAKWHRLAALRYIINKLTSAPKNDGVVAMNPMEVMGSVTRSRDGGGIKRTAAVSSAPRPF
jgi:hypothetical protein